MNAKKTILVIEDDYEVRNSVVDILEVNNFNVLSAADGKSGFNLLNKLRPDLIICDIMLPGIDGYQILSKVHEIYKNQDPVPFIFLTAKTTQLDIRKGMNLGADDYIPKPFRAKDLLAAVKTRLERYESFKIVQEQPVINEKNRLNINQGIMISDRNKNEFVKVKNIIYLNSVGDYCTLHLQNGKQVVSSKNLKEWENLLPSDFFYRTHRSYIVNIEQIEEIKPWFKRSYKILLKDSDDEVFISERNARRLKKIINN